MQVQITVEGKTFSDLEQGLEDALAEFVGDSGASVELVQVGQAQQTSDGRPGGAPYRLTQGYEVRAPVADETPATPDTTE